MSFSLSETRLWRHVDETATPFPLLEAKTEGCDDQMKKIYICEEKICEFQDNSRKTIVKMRKMYTNTLQKEFLFVKASKEKTFKDIWEYLKIWYTLQNLASQWNTLRNLHEIWH